MSAGDSKDQQLIDEDGYENEDSDRAEDSAGETDEEHARAERSGQHDEDECTMFVKNFNKDVTEKDLKDIFPDCIKIRIPLRDDGNPKGFAYLVFESADEVKTLIDDKQGCELNGCKLYLDYEGKNSKSKPSKRRFGRNSKSLYVSRLTENVTEKMLKEAFDKAKSTRVIVNKDSGKSKGYGFVEFTSHEDAKEALEENKDLILDEQEVSLDFAAGPRGGFRGFRRGGWFYSPMYRYGYGDGWDRGFYRGYGGFGRYPRGFYRGGRGGFRRGYGRPRGGRGFYY